MYQTNTSGMIALISQDESITPDVSDQRSRDDSITPDVSDDTIEG